MKTKKLKYFGKPGDPADTGGYTKIYDVNGKAVLKLKAVCPGSGLLKSICDKYTEYIDSAVFPEIRNDFESSDMERKYLRYPCGAIGITVTRSTVRKKVVDRIELTYERDNERKTACPIMVIYK